MKLHRNPNQRIEVETINQKGPATHELSPHHPRHCRKPAPRFIQPHGAARRATTRSRRHEGRDFRSARDPVFNQDEEKSPPAIVTEFKKRIRAADAILIATPEYNYSVPGVLKNAIDWASRPYGDSAWNEKPVAVISASGGVLGGARAQYHLRQSFIFLNMHPLNLPEVMIAKAQEKFDANGNLTDEASKKLIQQLLQNLVAWTRRLAK
jgi:chromate reductase, NAD(P)H dehydrogenase (quinone)